MTTIPEEAVKSADIIQVITDLRLAILQDDDEGLAEHAEPMVKAKELIAKLSASPFLPVQGAVKKLEWWQDSAENHRAETPFGNEFIKKWMDSRDGNISYEHEGAHFDTVEAAKAAAQADYEARILSALEPSAARELALEEGDLNARLKAKGMYSIDEMMGSLPLDKWRVHSGMTDLKFFGEWLERKTRDYCTMRAAYEVGDKDESDELYEWVLAHHGAFHDVLVNFRAALSSPDHFADAGKLVEGDGCPSVKGVIPTKFGESICFSGIDDARLILVSVCGNSGLVPVKYLLPHQLYVHDVQKLSEQGEVLVCAVPVYDQQINVTSALPSAPSSEGAE